MRHRFLAAALAAAALVPSSAHAGGMYLTDRGTRPLGRGFAFVAGADDAGAFWYNPAGLSEAGQQIFFDATLTLFDADYTRIDGGGNVLPTVEASPEPLPVPMAAYTHPIGDFTVGGAILVPNVVPLGWPEEITVDGNPEPAPQRYSLIDLAGSAFAHIVLGGAWQVTPELSLGAGVHLVAGRLVATTTLSACDRVICTQPENPDYDGLAQIDLPIFAPTATVGATYDLGVVRIGASFTLPHDLGGSATVRVRVPSAAIFDGARVEGDDADVELDMPFILRGGVEVRPVRGLRVEAAAVYEAWSVQDRMRVVPEDVWLRDVNAIGDYQVGPIDIPRHMNDVVSLRLGGEYAIGAAGRLVVRGGVNWESSSFDDAYLTALTLDSSKVVVGLGASYEVSDGMWVDASYGHVFLADREVRDSRVPPANPIRPPPSGAEPPDGPVFVGNGDYSMEANAFGLGLRWILDAPADERPDEEAAPDEPTPAPAPSPDSPAAQDDLEDLPWGSEGGQPWYQREE